MNGLLILFGIILLVCVILTGTRIYKNCCIFGGYDCNYRFGYVSDTLCEQRNFKNDAFGIHGTGKMCGGIFAKCGECRFA